MPFFLMLELLHIHIYLNIYVYLYTLFNVYKKKWKKRGKRPGLLKFTIANKQFLHLAKTQIYF